MKTVIRNTAASVLSRALPRVAPLPIGRAAVPGVIPGRIVIPAPPPTPHLPPVHFFAESNVDAGAEATLRSEALSNRTGRPVEIHEIRLSARISPTAGLTDVNPAAFIRVRIGFGGKPVTRGFVPIWALGKNEVQLSQQNSGTEAIAMYVWRLSRPWHVTAKTPIEVEFQHTGGVKFSTRAQIGLAGRYASSKATTSSVPYASSFVSRPFQYAEVGFDESSEKDLVNVTGRVVNVDRMIGRVAVARTGASGISTITDDLDQGPLTLVLARILTSRNLPIVRDYAAHHEVFGNCRALDVPHLLSPGDFYRVGVKKIAGEALATPFTTWTAQSVISVIGSREEAI